MWPMMLVSAAVLGGVSVACYIMLRRVFRLYKGAEESVRGLTVGIFGRLRKVEEMVRELPRVGAFSEGVLNRLEVLEREVESLSEALKGLETRVSRVEEALKTVPEAQRAVAKPPAGALTLEGLTPTEVRILRILASEGAMTASGLRERVGRSREHVSRLLKKLYERGFIERDVSEIPYKYAVRDEVKGMLEAS